MPNYYWHRCPKCQHTISTPLQRLEAWCLRCGKRMTCGFRTKRHSSLHCTWFEVALAHLIEVTLETPLQCFVRVSR